MNKVDQNKLPLGWTVAPLKDVCEILDNLRQPINSSERAERIKNKQPSELYPYYGATGQVGLIDDYITDGEYVLIGEDAAPFFDSSKDVAYEIKGKTWVNNHAHILKSFFNNRFLKYYLNIFDYDGFVSGTTRLKLTKGSLEKIPVKVAPLNEQNRIVDKLDELLSELEKGKEQLQTSLEQLKVYRQSILKHAFEGKLTNENVKDGELPKSWSIKLISELCDVVRGGSPRPAGDPRYYGGNIPFLKVADLTKDDKVYVSQFEYTIKEAGLKKTRQIKTNTLLLTNSGATLGVPKITKIDATMNDGIAAFLNLDEKSIHYIYYFWKSKTKELRSLNQGAAQPNLNTDIIKNYRVPYCSFEEQQLIVEAIELRFSESEKMEEEILSSILKLDSLRSSILQKAFEGKLVEQDPTDEPANVLLERIKKEREEYLKAEKERKKTEKLHTKKRKNMAEELKQIIDILKNSKEPVLAKTLWQLSTHKDDIDEFYAELKKHIEAGEIIELPRKGKESFLKLADAK